MDNRSADSSIQGWIYAAQIWAVCVAIVGIVGNVMTIAIITWQYNLWEKCHRRRPRSLSTFNLVPLRPVIPFDGYTILLLHLSICDLLYCSVNLPITIYTYSYASEPSAPSDSFCKGAGFFRYLNALVEWLTLALITVQRCVDLRRSKGMRFFKPKPTIILIVLVWVFSSVPQIITLFDTKGSYFYNNVTLKCDIKDATAKMLFYSLESALPCFLMPVGCVSIIYQIWSNIRRLRKNGVSEELVMNRLREMLRSVTLILTLLLIFLICVIPICAYNIVCFFIPEDNIEIGIVIYMIYWLQYAVNVYLYVVRNENFKKAAKQFLFFCRKRLVNCGAGPGRSPSSNSKTRNSKKWSVHSITKTSVHSFHLETSNETTSHLDKTSRDAEEASMNAQEKMWTLSVCTVHSTVSSKASHITIVTGTTDVSY